MSVKLFITGVTGYIAGDAVHALYEAHPEYEYVLLVRTQGKVDTVKQAFPNAAFVIGSLDDSALLKDQAAKADIVLHAADSSDHEGAAKAIRDGLIGGHSVSRPGYWIHVSGTGILTYTDAQARRFGEWSDKQYNDWTGVEELTSLPDEAFHRNVDQIVLGTSDGHGDAVRTAVVCPPTIYGLGRGPVSGRSRQVYELAKLILQDQTVPLIGSGKARWNNVHVADLSNLFLALVEAAVRKDNRAEVWNKQGYYFAENGEMIWQDIARLIGAEAVKSKLLSDPKETPLDYDSVMKRVGWEGVSWGLNSRAKAERARKLLGWSPKEQSIEAEIPLIVQSEQRALQEL